MESAVNPDTFAGGGCGSITSRIGRIIINGAVIGSPVTFSTMDSFRFMAQKIGAFRVGGVAFPLPPAANSLSVGDTADTRVFDAF